MGFQAKISLKNGKITIDTGVLDCYNKRAENEVGTDGVRPHPAAMSEQRSIIIVSALQGRSADFVADAFLKCIRIYFFGGVLTSQTWTI